MKKLCYGVRSEPYGKDYEVNRTPLSTANPAPERGKLPSDRTGKEVAKIAPGNNAQSDVGYSVNSHLSAQPDTEKASQLVVDDMIEKFVSGGQTGADRAALDVALRHGIPHGGWCPKGRKAEDGIIGGQYQLVETPSANYLQRTEWNVRDTDGTAIFTFAAKLSGGSLRTFKFAIKQKRPCVHISRAGIYEPALALQQFVHEHGIKRLNVAGSRESKEPGIWKWAYEVIDDAFFGGEKHPCLLGGPGEG